MRERSAPFAHDERQFEYYDTIMVEWQPNRDIIERWRNGDYCVTRIATSVRRCSIPAVVISSMT